MTVLWMSLIVCAAVFAIRALRMLDQERRSFFATASREARGGRLQAGTYADRLRHIPSAVRGMLGAITAHRGDRMSHAGRNGTLSVDLPQRRPRREHAAKGVMRALSEAAPAPPSASGLPAAPTAGGPPPADKPAPPAAAIDTAVSAPGPTGEGTVRVDPDGQLHSPDQNARGLLHWSAGPLTLGEILAGGNRQATALLESVARREVVEHAVTVLTGGSSQQLHITALASRSSDGGFRGALLIMRRL